MAIGTAAPRDGLLDGRRSVGASRSRSVNRGSTGIAGLWWGVWGYPLAHMMMRLRGNFGLLNSGRVRAAQHPRGIRGRNPDLIDLLIPHKGDLSYMYALINNYIPVPVSVPVPDSLPRRRASHGAPRRTPRKPGRVESHGQVAPITLHVNPTAAES